MGLPSVYLGRYYIPDGSKPIGFKLKMPIEWLVLAEDEKNGKSLLISKNTLDWDAYAFFSNYEGKHKRVKWNNTFLKKYLEELYNSYFSDEEKDAILPSELGALHILSFDEISRYLPSPEKRRATMLFVDNFSDELKIFLEHQTYWVREDEAEIEEMSCINEFGELESISGEAEEIGIRPAMWVDTKKARILTAKAGYNKWHHFWEYEEF